MRMSKYHVHMTRFIFTTAFAVLLSALQAVIDYHIKNALAAVQMDIHGGQGALEVYQKLSPIIDWALMFVAIIMVAETLCVLYYGVKEITNGGSINREESK